MNVFLLIYLIYLIYYICIIFYKHVIVKELDLINRYGKETYVMITGASSGQGKRYAIEFSKRGFNIILAGYSSCNKVADYIKQKYKIKTHVIECNFINAWKKNFFEKFEKVFNTFDISVLINNVGYRSGWKCYENMPTNEIRNTIAVGTMVQSILTKLALKKFKTRNKLFKSAIINITTLLSHSPLVPFQYPLYTIPYLSVYESSNAYGFFHSNSIQKEYKNIYDILNITPGAVLTENTQYLKNTIGVISSKQFVKNCIKLLGNVSGTTCGYWKHELYGFIAFLAPTYIFTNIGDAIACDFMKKKIIKVTFHQ